MKDQNDNKIPDIKIKIFRLKTGVDIAASFIENGDNTVTLINPMLVGRMNNGDSMVMYMVPWLPIEIVKYDMAMIYTEDVMSVFDPTEDFIGKYSEAIFHAFDALLKSSNEEDGMYKEIWESSNASNILH